MKILNIAQSWANAFFATDARLVFLLICMINILTVFIQQEFVMTEEMYYNSFGEQLAMERIDALITFNQKWQWASYLIIPIIVFFQVLVITICINIGTLVADYKISFKQLFGMVVKAIIVFALLKLMIAFILWQFANPQNLDDILNANYHSVLVLIDVVEIPEWLFYPLYLINIGQVIFLALLGFGIVFLLKIRYRRALTFVLATYGTGLILWALFIVFVQLSLQ